jgi:hypothetical protein
VRYFKVVSGINVELVGFFHVYSANLHKLHDVLTVLYLDEFYVHERSQIIMEHKW